jgi:hypothetical protein
MHTIVIHFGKKYEDWHLIEPFFYKLQNARDITFYWEEGASASSPLFLSLVDTMVEHLNRHRIRDWQLIILLNLNDERNRQMRLTSQLSEIRNSLLLQIRDKGFYPLQTMVHLIDMLKRDSDYAPHDKLFKRYWELDHYGYLFTHHDDMAAGNSFTYLELDQLDKEWGEPIALANVVLDHPDEEFMQSLNDRCDRVERNLYELIGKKKMSFEQAGAIKLHDDWLTTKQLEFILEDFLEKMKSIKTLPLTQALISFTPSKELSNSLKHNVSIQSSIGDIRLVRQHIVQSSHRERIKGYIELAYFILTLTHHSKLIERMEKGSANVIQVTLDEERLETLLTNYFKSLLRAKRHLEDQLLLQNHFHTHRYRDDEFAPYTAASLDKKSSEETLQPMGKKITRHYYEQWQDQLTKIEMVLVNREKELFRTSREAISKLNVLKRKNEFLEEEELIEINDYKQELTGQIHAVHQEVIDSAPSLSEALSTWRKHVTIAKKKMDFLLQQIPDQRQFMLISMLAFLCLLVPFLQTCLSDSPKNWGWSYFVILLPLMLLFTYAGYFFTKRSSHQPVWRFQEETSSYTEKMYQLQVESQHRYNGYLNHLFQLFSLRKYHEKISAIGEDLKENNILLRYHLIKLEEYVEVSNRLLHVLQINKDHSSESLVHRVPAVKYEKSVMENPIYSPFQQLGVTERNSHGIEVYLGSAREQYPSSYIHELERIRIQEDKVYKL